MAKDRPYIFDPIFEKRNAKRLLFDDVPKIEARSTSWIDFSDSEKNTNRGGRHRLSREDERLLFLQFNYCRYKAHKTKGAASARWRRDALKIRNDLAGRMFPMAAHMAKDWRIPGYETRDIILAGVQFLLQRIDAHDISRGSMTGFVFKALRQHFWKLSQAELRRPLNHVVSIEDVEVDTPFRQGRTPAPLFIHRAETGPTERDRKLEALRSVIKDNLAHLSSDEFRAVRSRFALGSTGRNAIPSVENVAWKLNVSMRRLYQSLSRALRKIKRAIGLVLQGEAVEPGPKLDWNRSYNRSGRNLKHGGNSIVDDRLNAEDRAEAVHLYQRGGYSMTRLRQWILDQGYAISFTAVRNWCLKLQAAEAQG